jgi:hypothetical protein
MEKKAQIFWLTFVIFKKLSNNQTMWTYIGEKFAQSGHPGSQLSTIGSGQKVPIFLENLREKSRRPRNQYIYNCEKFKIPDKSFQREGTKIYLCIFINLQTCSLTWAYCVIKFDHTNVIV